MRKLLPYEHALINELGITEEEYFAFRKAQQEYKDLKAGSILDIRNGAETLAIISIALSVIGTVAQVAAALLAPRPEAPDVGGGNRRARDRRFAPRYGFDSVQELAQYGDPVNLVYTNQGTGFNDNPNGGVRVNTSLLWSAVYSYGNAQYLQMMAVVGASDISAIDYNRTAFGSTLTRLFTSGAAWIYSRNNGRILFSDRKVPALSATNRDPAFQANSISSTIYDPIVDFNTRSEGFSQAYSPSSASEFGITAPIPIKVNVSARNEDGQVNEKKQPVDIEAENRGAFWPAIYQAGSRPRINPGQKIIITIAKVKDRRNDSEADNFADEIRSRAAESIELGGLYKLGSAKFQIIGINGDTELDQQRLSVTLECTADGSGVGPFEDYQTEDIQEQEAELEAEKKRINNSLNPLIKGSLVYQLNNLGGTQFATADLTNKQARLFNKVKDQLDSVEELYETAISYRRGVDEMDKFISNLVPDEVSSLDPIVQDAMNKVAAQENEVEKKRRRVRRIDAVIATNGSTQTREENLVEAENNLAMAKRALRRRRSQLAKALEEYGVAQGVVATQVDKAQQIIKEIQAEFNKENFKDLANIEIPPYLKEIPLDPQPRRERRALKKLKNILHNISARLSSIAQYDYTAEQKARDALQKQIDEAFARLQQIDAQLSNPNSFNDYLGTKCLVRLHEADYETLSPVDLVHFSFKAKVFMRIQGRASKYGETDVKKYKDSDNGYKTRTAMFRALYRKIGETEWDSPDIIFCIRKTHDKESFIPLIFQNPEARTKWQFKFEPVFDAPSEAVKAGAALNFVYLEARGPVKNAGVFRYRGYSRRPGINNLPPRNHSPYGVDEWTVFSTHADTSIQYSFDSGPEFRLVTVTEQQLEPLANYPQLYSGMTTLGVNAYSSAGLTNVRNLSVFVTKGKLVRNIELSPPSCPSSPNAPSCWAPDIFLDTILDRTNGIGEYVGASSIKEDFIDYDESTQNVIKTIVDIESLALAKAFCIKNQYYMDGIIADKTAWRAFWSEVAPYSLLELAKIGGKETLIPAVPTTGDGTITRNINVAALFNQGNILEDSYKEDFIDYGESTQDVIVTIVYRDQPVNEPFPRNTSVTVKLKGTSEALASRRTFDLSNFVTNRTQAIHYAMLLCSQRRHVRRAVEFKTFPTEAPIQPGAYIYVHMEENQWNDVHSGMVLDDGSLNIPFASESVNGTFPTLIYRQGQDPIKQNIAYTNGQASALSAFPNALFVLGTAVSGKRVFRVVEVAMEEEGEVTIRAVEHPCIEEGGQTKSLIARFSTGLYDIS